MANILVNKQEKNDLLATFQALDLDGNGVLTVDELIQGYKSLYPEKTEKEIQATVTAILGKLDADGSGEIDFTEFVVASMAQSALLNGQKISRAFEMFDSDGDGFIDRKELKAAMGGMKLTDAEWDKLIQQYDTDGDGKVVPIFIKDLQGGIYIHA
jgi:calcium-dependent protein kinase